jgi:tetratricopeptide (TPR) repeat protein
MPDTPVRKVTIFVSSPKDVAPERGRVQAVTAKLNREYEGLVRFETVLWEEHFYTADRSFQPQIPEAVASDIVVSIFWTRIGTELPADFSCMPNGKPYPSGTAYELITALEASKAKGVPDVYVFRKIADATLPMADAERRRQAQTQLDALDAFWSEWFRSEKGEFKAAFQNFPSTDAFEQQVELLLRQWLETRGLLGPRIAWPKEKGSPFRGLAPFEAEHAAVFFGRDRVTDEARRRLVGAAERGTPFLLIVGASGSGKSSLARAGLIPRLTTPGVVAAVDLWRVVRMKPGEGQAGPLMALATALLAAEGLSELAHGDYPTAASLADNLRRGGTASAQPITSALVRVTEDAQRERHADHAPKPALVLLVDQFEELFAQGVGDAERAAFAESVRQLIATGRVWVVATLRADLYEMLLNQPALKALKETGASLDLGPPGPAELAEIVRAPAAAAGLVFETDNEKGELGERLLADAKTADSLPLLQFTLRQLYERREEVAGETRLTHAAYDQLGGLAGAIAAEAERAVSSLPPAAIATLPRLLRRLAEPARDGKALTLREVSRAEDVASETSEATLVNALLMARILIARTDADGRPTVRLAHDAVLASWPRASEAAQASREFYRVRADVEDALRRWQEHARPKHRLIQPGVPLAEAEKLVTDFGAELPAELTSYVKASRNRARVRQRLVAAAAIFFFILAVAATATGLWAIVEYDQAITNFEIAERTANSLVIDIARGMRNVLGMPVDTVRKILETAKGTFEQLAASAPDDRHLQTSQSIMLDEFGQTYETLGDLDSALKAYRDSVAIQERLAATDPSDAGRRRFLADTNAKAANVLEAQGKRQEALKIYRTSLAIVERLVAADPSNADNQADLSVLYQRVGNVLKERGELEEALKAFLAGRAIYERLAATDPMTDPSNSEWQRSLAMSNAQAGNVLKRQGKLEEALKAYRDSLAIAERLAVADRSNAEWQRTLLVLYEGSGDVLLRQDKLEEALKAYRDGIAIAERLAAADRHNAQWQRDLSRLHQRVGEALVEQGKPDEALKAYRVSLAILEQLAGADPSNTQWQDDLSFSYAGIGEVLVSQGNLDEALTNYRNGLAIVEHLAASDLNYTDWQRNLWLFYRWVGDVLLQQDNLEEALNAFRDSLTIAERLVASDRSNTKWQHDLSLSYEKIGDVLVKQDKLEEALQALRNSLAVAERLAASNPSNAEWQDDLSISYNKVGDVLVQRNQHEEALEAYRDGLAIAERSAASVPKYRRCAGAAGQGRGGAEGLPRQPLHCRAPGCLRSQ